MNNTNNKLILFQHCLVILSSSTSARMGPENPQGLLELNLPMKIRNGTGFGNVNDFFFLKERGAKGGGVHAKSPTKCHIFQTEENISKFSRCMI